jgi:hypothetical protein
MLIAHSSFLNLICASLYAASFDLCSMLNTNSSLDGPLVAFIHTTFTTPHDGIWDRVVSEADTLFSIGVGDVLIFATRNYLLNNFFKDRLQ